VRTLLGASREACAERHRRKKGRKPLFRSLRLVRRLFVVFGFAIKQANGIGDALDNGLLDSDFDGFVLVGGFDFAVVGGEPEPFVESETNGPKARTVLGEPTKQNGGERRA
jgi:hypothetical protein